MSYEYERAMGTENTEIPQQMVAVMPSVSPSERQPEPAPPRLEFRALTPNLSTNVGQSVQQITGSAPIGEMAACVTGYVIPTGSYLSIHNAFTWPILIPWVTAFLMYRHRVKQGSEKNEAIKSGAKTLLGLSLGFCTIGRIIFPGFTRY